MKISDRQYATALYQSLADLDKKAMTGVMDSFALLLKTNRHLSRLPKIMEIFSDIWDKEKGEAEVKITSAHKLSEKSREEILTLLKKEGLPGAKLSEEIDINLIGGFKARFKGLIIDASLRTSLQALEKNISN